MGVKWRSTFYSLFVGTLIARAWCSTISHILANHTENKFHVQGGYIAVHEINGSYRVVPPHHSCFDYASSIREPYSSAYWRRDNLEELNTSLPLAFWSWTKNITADIFYEASRSLHNFKYKIAGGKLYKDVSKPLPEGFHTGRQNETEELLKLAVYLFPLPDMEFLVHFSDSDGAGKPIITYTSNRKNPDAGFTMPSGGVWLRSLGPTQMTAYHACLRERYPADKRKPMAVWRGSNTGAVFPVDVEHCLKSVRVRLHLLSREHPDLMDTRLYHLVQRCAELIAPYINDTAPGMHMEEYNQYCVILDADGNGWSDRFANGLVHFPTVIMKEASNLTAYVEHMFPPEHAIEQFDSELTTIMDKVRAIVADCKKGPHSEGQKMVHRMQTTSRLLLDHAGVARAMAYTLLTYKRFIHFEPSPSLDGYERMKPPCCGHVSLPPEVIDRINQWLQS